MKSTEGSSQQTRDVSQCWVNVGPASTTGLICSYLTALFCMWGDIFDLRLPHMYWPPPPHTHANPCCHGRYVPGLYQEVSSYYVTHDMITRLLTSGPHSQGVLREKTPDGWSRLVQRRRRWTNLKPTLAVSLALTVSVLPQDVEYMYIYCFTSLSAHSGNIATEGSPKSGLCPTLI